MASTAHEAAAVRRPQTAQSTTQLMQALLRTVLRDPRGYFKLSQVTTLELCLSRVCRHVPPYMELRKVCYGFTL
eukprot:1680290-Rhodomonas_salina.1